MDSHERLGRATEGVEFERYVLSLLSAQALSEDRTLFVGNELPKRLAFADALAQTGLLDLPGPCLVEVRVYLTERIYDTVARAHVAIPNLASVLIAVRDLRQPAGRFQAALTEQFPQIRFRVMGRDELQQLAASHPAAALPFRHGNLNRAIGSLRDRRFDARSTSQHIAALRSAYNEDRLSLFIGAGVSRSARFLDWADLVRHLASTVFDNSLGTNLSDTERAEIQRYFESEVPASPLIVARMLHNSLKGGFADAVRGALYRQAGLLDTSPTLDEIATLCMPRRDRLGIVAVVNYNFDDLLERELSRRSIPHRPVLSEGEKPHKNELPIFHVHGYLPRKGDLTPAVRDALVLTEDAYHTQFVDPFIWTNLTQLNLLRNNVCLFVGHSMTDPNLRRLLEITAKKDASVRHYAILRDHWSGPAATKLSKAGQELTQVFKGLEELSMANLGVTVVWIKDFNEVANVLAEIRQ